MTISLRILTAKAFAPYGTIIEFDSSSGDSFQIIVREPEAPGWQIAVSKPSAGPIAKLAMHPNTRESFEPLYGSALIVVAGKHLPEKMEAFLLNKPVCLHKETWHATMAISGDAILKVTENSLVESREYELLHPIHLEEIAG